LLASLPPFPQSLREAKASQSIEVRSAFVGPREPVSGGIWIVEHIVQPCEDVISDKGIDVTVDTGTHNLGLPAPFYLQ
jgi:hypothetical protein